MAEYLIVASGCDDTTRAVVDLIDVDADTVHEVIAALNANSDYSCQPKLHMVRAVDAEGSDRDWLDEREASRA